MFDDMRERGRLSMTDVIDLTPKAESPRLQLRHRAVDEQLFDCARNVTRSNVIAVVGAQGGAGKTRLTFALGSALAQFAGLFVVSTDLDDDYGALLDLVPEATRSHRALEELEADGPVPLPQLRACLSVTRSRMLVLRGPEEETDLDEMLVKLGNADVVIFDCAAGLHRPRARWAMRNADQVIVVARPEASGAVSAAMATERALHDVHAPGILVINRRRGRSSAAPTEQAFVNVRSLQQTVHVPESPRLARGMEAQRYRIEDVDRPTRRAIKGLASAVGEQLR